MAPPPPIDLLSSCIMNNVPGNDGFMQEKQGSTVETAFEVKADSRRDRFFSTVGFGIVSTMYDHTAMHDIGARGPQPAAEPRPAAARFLCLGRPRPGRNFLSWLRPAAARLFRRS